MEAPKQGVLDQLLVKGAGDKLHYLHDAALDEEGGLDQLQDQVGEDQPDELLRVLGDDELHSRLVLEPLPEDFLEVVGDSVLVLGDHVDVPPSRRVEVPGTSSEMPQAPLAPLPPHPVFDRLLADIVLGEDLPELEALLEVVYHEYHVPLVPVDAAVGPHHDLEGVIHDVHLLVQRVLLGLDAVLAQVQEGGLRAQLATGRDEHAALPDPLHGSVDEILDLVLAHHVVDRAQFLLLRGRVGDVLHVEPLHLLGLEVEEHILVVLVGEGFDGVGLEVDPVDEGEQMPAHYRLYALGTQELERSGSNRALVELDPLLLQKTVEVLLILHHRLEPITYRLPANFVFPPADGLHEAMRVLLPKHRQVVLVEPLEDHPREPCVVVSVYLCLAVGHLQHRERVARKELRKLAVDQRD